MPIVRIPQHSFASGVMNLSRMRGRFDIKQYYSSVAGADNCLLHPQGGLYRRPGTWFMDEYTGQAAYRPIRFLYSESVKYLLIFYPDNIDVWSNNVKVHTITGTGLTATQIDQMDYSQSANSLILVHQSMPPKELIRGASPTSWTFGSITFTGTPLFAYTLTSSTPAGTLTPSAISGTITLTASVANFAATDVGGYLTGNGGEARITKFISTTVVEGRVTLPFINTTAIASPNWTKEVGYEAAWSVTRGYPGAVAFRDERLFLANTPLLPDQFWESTVGEYKNFDDTRGGPDDAFTGSLAADQINAIRAMVSGDVMFFITNDSEHYATGRINSDLDFQIKRQDERGCRQYVKPVFVDGAPIYVDAKADVLRELFYSDTDAKYNSTNLNTLSPGLLSGPVDLCHNKPVGSRDADLVFATNLDGSWVILNTLRREGITGFTTGTTQGELRWLCDVDGVLYGMFRRVVGGSTKIYLERFDISVYTDCTIQVTLGAPGTAVTGLTKLEGLLVQVKGDGFDQADRTVASGAITAEDTATVFLVGLGFTPSITLLPPNRELPDGTMIGEIRRVVAVTLGLSDTFDVYVNGRYVSLRDFGDETLDEPVPLFSGRRRVTLLGGMRRDPQIVITQQKPQPFHLTDVVLEVKTQ